MPLPGHNTTQRLLTDQKAQREEAKMLSGTREPSGDVLTSSAPANLNASCLKWGLYSVSHGKPKNSRGERRGSNIQLDLFLVIMTDIGMVLFEVWYRDQR